MNRKEAFLKAVADLTDEADKLGDQLYEGASSVLNTFGEALSTGGDYMKSLAEKVAEARAEEAKKNAEGSDQTPPSV